jgi:sulfate adenylyltransferase subunit 1
MDILRIATAGSVDDGKSTLIGRLLYETRSVTQDKLEAIDAASKRRGVDFLDLSLLTDGLIAEREQGITIDVAHVYFSTPKRKYIIADTPGHFEYTRNMVTGASKAAVSIILIDARNGVVEQTKRHYAINAMLRVPKVIVCVNKMDLVGYSQSRFDEIAAAFHAQASAIKPETQTLHFVPASSLYGENVTRASSHMPWYSGPTLLDMLECADAHAQRSLTARLQVQHVVRPRTTELHDYRGYAGRISSGGFAVGDEVLVLPNERASRITTIERFGAPVQQAQAGQSVVIQLADDIDISRGCMLAKPDEPIFQRKELRAKVCWLDHTPLSASKTYLLQHGVSRVRARVGHIHGVVNVANQQLTDNPPQLKLNEIGEASFRLAQPIFADAYANNPANGAFILIDEWSNTTAGVGFVEPIDKSELAPTVSVEAGI